MTDKIYSLTQRLVLAAVNKLIAQHGFTHVYQIVMCTTLPHETVRQNLRRFAEQGLLTMQETRNQGRTRKEYRLTDAGSQEIARLGELVTKLENNL